METKEDSKRLSVDSYQKSQLEIVSRLIINPVEESDTATYSCRVGDAHKKLSIRVQYGPGDKCVDQSTFQHCPHVVTNNLCSNKYYANFCCR